MNTPIPELGALLAMIPKPKEDAVNETIDNLLHDADRAQGGASFARTMGDYKNAKQLEEKAIDLYKAAMKRDPQMLNPAWDEDGNCDNAWLRWAGLEQITDRKPNAK